MKPAPAESGGGGLHRRQPVRGEPEIHAAAQLGSDPSRFTGANLVEADINGEKLYNANFSGADVSYADLGEISDISATASAAATATANLLTLAPGPGVNWKGANLTGPTSPTRT